MSTDVKKKGFLDSLTDGISKWLVPIGEKLQANNVIAAIAETMQATMPLIIIGSFAVMFLCIDIGPWQSWINSVPGLVSVLTKINTLTSGAYSLWVVLLLSYFYGNRINLKQNIVTIPVTAAVFFIVSPLTDGNISANAVGTSNLITAMLVGCLVPLGVKFLIQHKVLIRMPNSVPKFVEEGFAILVPAIILCVIAGVIDVIFSGTSYVTFAGFVYAMLQAPLTNIGLSYGGYAIIMCIASAILWPGLHANTIMGVVQPLTLAASAANLAALQAGETLPNIIEYEFNMIMDPGGQASLLIPCLLGLFFCKSKQIKQVSKVGFIPAIFGIGEPILFGFPCMFNPLMIIPMVLSTFWNVTCWYVAIVTGLVGRFSGLVLPWTTPPLLNSALASTTPVAAVICHIVMLVVNALIWLPFVRAYDRQLFEKENAAEKAEA
ncbi:PTS sugar transporter subunit IIC [Traorella massiliensis]|uniref:PTS sugar transporter subunit IIC n=1 Tax=Traorella massiliensis TaxID=1903263 RepID=UPI0008F88D14|nr:PTS transporter subunit EIIC [Traorella massiliensis]